MRKRIQGKILFAVMLLFIFVSASGCMEERKREDARNEEDKADQVYNGEKLLLDGIGGSISDVIVQYGRIGIVTGEWLDSAYTERKMHVYVMNSDQSDFREIPLAMPENGRFIRYAFDGEGNLIYITGIWNADTYAVEMVKIDVNGKELLKVPLHLDENVICGLLADGEGNVILAQPKSISVFDRNFQYIETIEADKEKEGIDGIAFEKNGRVICSQWYYDGEKAFLSVREVEINPLKWGTAYEMPLKENVVADNILMNGWGGYDFCYSDSDGLYGYLSGKKRSVKLLDFVASNMTELLTHKILPLEDGHWIGMVYDEEAETELAVYHKVDPEVAANRKTVVVGMFGIDDDTRKAAVRFNREHTDYQIELRDYLEADDPLLQMNTEIIAGKSPDILDVSYTSLNQYIEKGLLEDLAPYMERDPEINMRDLIPSVSEAIEKNHNIYFVAPSFQLYSLAARKKEVGEKEGWTLEEMEDVLKKKDKGVHVFYWNDKMDILYTLLEMNVSDFVDWQEGKCYFDGEAFKELLALAEQMGTDGVPEQSGGQLAEEEAIQEGEVLFWEGNVDLARIYMNQRILGEEVAYIGYPNEEREGSYFQFSHPFAIYSKSGEKEAAWEFIRIFMTKEFQGKMDLYGSSMPTRQDCYDLMVEANLAAEAYTNEMGRDIIPGAMWSAYSLIYNDMPAERNPLTQKEADALTALVGKTKRCVSYEAALMDIIQEEAEIYFAGEKNLEDTVRIIQKRALTYVNENR